MSGRRLVAAGGAALLAAACSSGGDAPQPPDPPPPPPPVVAAIDLVDAFSLLAAFSQPVALVQPPADRSRWYVVERAGRIFRFDNRDDVSTRTLAADLTAIVDSGPGEAGLLGLAFDPEFSANGEIYLSFTRPGLTSYVSRFFSFDGGATFDVSSEQVLLTVPQDFGNHNGGNLLFGPDGFLYVGFGDGGSANDPLGRAQDTTNLLGTIVRIDVRGGSPYAIPAGNPFAGNAMCTSGFGGGNCPEIFAWGLRNPWRFTFDETTGQLWAGDVGQGTWEEIDIVEAGGNYGWPIREGAHCHEPPSGCTTAGLTDPVAEYGRSQGQSVTGGYVYRGGNIAGLDGTYLYTDFGSGRIFALPQDLSAAPRVLLETSLNPASFGQDADGTLYLLDYGGGRMWRIVDAS